MAILAVEVASRKIPGGYGVADAKPQADYFDSGVWFIVLVGNTKHLRLNTSGRAQPKLVLSMMTTNSSLRINDIAC